MAESSAYRPFVDGAPWVVGPWGGLLALLAAALLVLAWQLLHDDRPQWLRAALARVCWAWGGLLALFLLLRLLG